MVKKILTLVAVLGFSGLMAQTVIVHPHRVKAKVLSEGNDSFTKFLLHFDGSQGSTTFINDGAGGYKTNAVADGNANIHTSKKYFGSGSAYFDADNDGALINSSDDTDLSASNWTIDFWVNFNALSVGPYAPFAGAYMVETIGFMMVNDKKMDLYLSSGTAGSWDITGGGPKHGTKNDYVTNQWYHYALSWDGAVYRMYVNGTEDIAVTSSVGIRATTAFQAGRWSENSFDLNGYVDELRISKGIARWTNNFTPPTQSYGE